MNISQPSSDAMADTTSRNRKPRRFYAIATMRAEMGGFAVILDDRIAKTAGGAQLIVPSPTLAVLLAGEWAAQTEGIDFAAMPATRLAFTAIDRTAIARGAIAGEVARFAEADLLCYFADAPAALIDRQERDWGPWLAWAERALGLVLVRAKGLHHQTQPPETPARALALAETLDDFTLTGLAFAAALYGSAVLAFAVQRGVLSAEAAFDLSRLDEAFQERQWGVDAEAAARTERHRRDARMIGDWFATLKGAETG
jgi:chaperone required for assembly of F1-ATPase